MVVVNLLIDFCANARTIEDGRPVQSEDLGKRLGIALFAPILHGQVCAEQK